MQVGNRIIFALAVLATATLGSAGCSWLFVKPLPPDYQAGDRVDCTTSPAAPIADTLLAASNIAGVLYITGTAGNKPTPTQNALVTSALVWTIVDITSAVHGYRATAACRAALDDDERPRRRLVPLPHPLAPPSPRAVPTEPEVAPAPADRHQQTDDDDPNRPPKPAPPPLPAQS